MVSLENLVDKFLLAAFNDELMKDVINPLRELVANIDNEATCTTAAGTAAKTVVAPTGFKLVNKATIVVVFQNAIATASATLQVGETAAKPIYYRGAALEADLVEAGDRIMLRYDGTSYNVIGCLGGGSALPFNVYLQGADEINESTQVIVAGVLQEQEQEQEQEEEEQEGQGEENNNN